MEDVVYFLHGDHLGSTVLTTDGEGRRVGEVRYRPYGTERYRWGSIPTDRRFTGRRWEGGVGLYDYRARWYDPALGRFVQPDTLVPEPANPQDLNRYAYVRNNPPRYLDLTGHCTGLTGIAYDVCKAAVLAGQRVINKLNEYREAIFFPDKDTTFADRLRTCTVVGGGSVLVSAGATEVIAGTLTTAATTGGATTVTTAATTATTAAYADGDCFNEVRAAQRLVEVGLDSAEAAKLVQQITSASTNNPLVSGGTTVLGKYPEYIQLDF